MFSEAARNFASTPYGLFLGTQNSYHGLEIWRGARGEASLASARLLESETIGDHRVVLSWKPPEGATRFRIFRSTFTSNGELQIPELDADRWVPDAFAEIGVTEQFHFVDTTVDTSQHYYHYYVRAEDAAGVRSKSSNLVRAPSLAPAVTFDGLRDTIAKWVWQAQVASSSQGDASELISSLEDIRHDVTAGDLDNALMRAAHLRQMMRANQLTSLPSWRVADLEVLLTKLERRIRLIKAGILSPATLD